AAALRGRPSPETPGAMLHFAERHMCRLDPWPEVLTEVRDSNPEVRDALWGPTEFQISGSLRGYHRIDQLGQLDIPVLLLCGANDFTSPRMCSAFADALRNARLCVIENASHMAHLEDPAECGVRLREFFGALAP
ncbi:alpha/beta fold hydrolase, partial [Crossiella equi]